MPDAQSSAAQQPAGLPPQPARQNSDDVVRDLLSHYPGVIQWSHYPGPDTAMVRLHRKDSTWVVSIVRLEDTGA